MMISWLGESNCHDVSVVGGKVANLSRLAAGYQIPPGFCLTTAAFEHWSGGQADGTQARLDTEFRAALNDAYAELASRTGQDQPSVAVRSSAVDEDGRVASFAGQYETYLNIVGVDAIAQAVGRCWDSLSSQRVMDYRRRYGLPLDSVHVAVLVQQLVPADVSAVVFSANPVDGNTDEVIINASWGLGESIVGGTVTPDTYVVRKSDREITDRTIASKQHMTVLTGTGTPGTMEVSVPGFMQTQQCLEDPSVTQMADLALDLESQLGWPVDVECALQEDDLYLLQCRPVTTLIRPE